jgi:hypothetical protein
MLPHEYSSCQDKIERKLEVIGGAGVRGGKENWKLETEVTPLPAVHSGFIRETRKRMRRSRAVVRAAADQ